MLIILATPQSIFHQVVTEPLNPPNPPIGYIDMILLRSYLYRRSYCVVTCIEDFFRYRGIWHWFSGIIYRLQLGVWDILILFSRVHKTLQPALSVRRLVGHI